MPRIGGDSGTYAWRWGYVNEDGSFNPTEYGENWPSVTTIINSENPQPWMKNWVKKCIAQGVADVLADRREQGITDPGDVFTTQKDVEQQLSIYGMLPDQIRDTASDRGTKAHEYLEALCSAYNNPNIQNIPATDSKFEEQVLLYFDNVMVGLDIKYGGTQPVWSSRLRAVGTPDLVTDGNGFISMIDLKTRNDVKPRETDKEQVAAYGMMYEELHGVEVANHLILIVTENEWRQVEMTPEEVTKYRDLFEIHREAYRVRKGI